MEREGDVGIGVVVVVEVAEEEARIIQTPILHPIIQTVKISRPVLAEPKARNPTRKALDTALMSQIPRALVIGRKVVMRPTVATL